MQPSNLQCLSFNNIISLIIKLFNSYCYGSQVATIPYCKYKDWSCTAGHNPSMHSTCTANDPLTKFDKMLHLLTNRSNYSPTKYIYYVVFH